MEGDAVAVVEGQRVQRGLPIRGFAGHVSPVLERAANHQVEHFEGGLFISELIPSSIRPGGAG